MLAYVPAHVQAHVHWGHLGWRIQGSLEAFLDPLRVSRALIYRACAQNQASGNLPDGPADPDGGPDPDEMEPGGAIQTSTSTRRGPG